MRTALLMLTGLGVMFVGCDLMQGEKTDAIASSDPVPQFKPIVEKFIPAYNEMYKSIEGKHDIIESVVVDPMGAKFDVKKSDSVVSPYVGEIHADGYVSFRGLGPQLGTFSFYFAFQEGKWVPESGHFSGEGGFKVTEKSMANAMKWAEL